MALSEMVLSDSFVFYLLNPLQVTGIISADDSLEWYRRVVESHQDSNENRGYYILALVKRRKFDDALREIQRGCSVEPEFFKYAGDEFYEFMRAMGRHAEAENLMAAAEGR